MNPNWPHDMDVDEGDDIEMEVDVEEEDTVVAEPGGSTAIPVGNGAVPDITLTIEKDSCEYSGPRQIREDSPWTNSGSDPSFVSTGALSAQNGYLTAPPPTVPGDGWRTPSKDSFLNPAFDPSMWNSEHSTPSNPNSNTFMPNQTFLLGHRKTSSSPNPVLPMWPAIATLPNADGLNRSNSTRSRPNAGAGPSKSNKRRRSSLSPSSSPSQSQRTTQLMSPLTTPSMTPSTTPSMSPFPTYPSTPVTSRNTSPGPGSDPKRLRSSENYVFGRW